MNYRKINYCRLCKSKKLLKIFDLSKTPIGNNLLKKNQIKKKINNYPLAVNQCSNCGHHQLSVSVNKKLLYAKNYTYLTGISPVFREYLDKYSKYIAKKFKLNQKDFVMEIGSNDGTLLQSFKKNIGCKILGIDPSKEPSKIAKKNNINVINSFFSFELAKKIKKKYNSPKLITTHNTFAHVENIHDFFKGIEYLSDDNTQIVIEIGYWLKVMKNYWFDTIYHEHHDYYSLKPLVKFFHQYNYNIIDFRITKPQGGSLMIFLQKNNKNIIYTKIKKQILEEISFGLYNINNYKKINDKLKYVRNSFINKLIYYKKRGFKIDAYGSPTKAVTLLSFLKIPKNIIRFIYEDNKLKCNLYNPYNNIPIIHSSKISQNNPDVIVILAWNFYRSIFNNLKKRYKRKIVFIVPLPKPFIIK